MSEIEVWLLIYTFHRNLLKNYTCFRYFLTKTPKNFKGESGPACGKYNILFRSYVKSL